MYKYPLVVNFISAKQRCLVKSSFQFFWGEVKTGSLNSIYKTDRENKDHKMSMAVFMLETLKSSETLKPS